MPSLNETPSGHRLHISIFGRRNAGKSSLINALTAQSTAIVSKVPGTTTDPVTKAMEILPIGPVMITDTAGIDDIGELGQLRIDKSLRVIDRTDLALLVIDPQQIPYDIEEELLSRFSTRNCPLIAVINKDDLPIENQVAIDWANSHNIPSVKVSSLLNSGINELKRLIIAQSPSVRLQQSVLIELVRPGDCVLLVTPIDKAAPAGRLILPQVMTIRDALDHDAYTLVVKERELRQALANLRTPPNLVITDSQVVLKAAADTPDAIPFTTFSILMARMKGDLSQLVRGVLAMEKLLPGDKVLIAEACSHHCQADDIGKVQIPRWLRQHIGGDLIFDHCSGADFPTNLSEYKLIIHCGACMINRQAMLSRGNIAAEAGVPIVNYGVFLSYIHGVLERTLRPFPLAHMILEEERD